MSTPTPPAHQAKYDDGSALDLFADMHIDSAIAGDQYDDEEYYSRFDISPMLEYEWILLIANITIMVTSLVLNVSVIYFICGQPKARTAHNITIVSIAVSDIMVAIFVMPTYLTVSMYQVSLGVDELTPFLCKLQTYTWYWGKTVTIYSVVAMVCDRYNRVKNPRKCHVLSGRYMFFLSFLWFFGAAYNVWQLIIKSSAYITVHTDTGQNVTVRACYSLGPYQYLEGGFIFVDFIMIFLLPCSVIIYMYVHMIYIICRRPRSVQPVFPSRRRFFMSIFLVCLFMMCQLPFEILDTQMYFTLSVSYWNIALSKLFDTLSFSQGVLNVIAYASCSTDLHKVVREKLFKRQGKREMRFHATAQLCALTTPQVLIRSSSTRELRNANAEVMVLRRLLAKRAST